MSSQLAAKRIGIVASNSPSYVDAMLTCAEQGDVAVPLRKDDDAERIIAAEVTDIVTPTGMGGWLERRFSPQQSDNLAQISFTSGTEGAPKGVLLTHRALHDVHERLQDVMKLDSSVREYVGVPVYHSFGYARCRTVCAVGGKAFIPDKGFSPAEIVSMLRADQINAISAVPTLWRILMAHSNLLEAESRKVRWIEIGSQYMSGSEKAQLRGLFPNAVIIQHYGLTEASRSTLLQVHSENAANLESVGKPTGRVQVRVEDDGHIAIRGPHVALAALVGGREVPITDFDGWFRTNDLGRIQDEYLYFAGRADDVINCGGIKVDPDALENRIRAILNINEGIDINEGIAVARTVDALRGDGIVVAKEASSKLSTQSLRVATIEAMRDQGLNAPAAVVVGDVEAIPRTATGKVQRRQLSAIFQSRNAATCSSTKAPSLYQVICRSLRADSINPAYSFEQLGGDSLSHLEVSLVLEKSLGYLPPRWELIPIANLERLIEPKCALAVAEVGPREQPEPRRKAPPLPQGEINRNPEGLSFWSLVKEDYQTNGRSIFSQGFIALFVNRFGNWRMSIRWKLFRAPLTLLYFILAKLCQIFCGIKLDYTVSVGRKVKLEHFGGMILGARRIGNGAILRQNTTLGIRSISDLNAKPTIEDNVDIGAGAVIVGNVTIGRGSIIGANSVVYTDVPPFSLVEGNPAKIVTMGER